MIEFQHNISADKFGIWTPRRLQTFVSSYRYDCSRILGLLMLRLSQGKDYDELFARRFPTRGGSGAVTGCSN